LQAEPKDLNHTKQKPLRASWEKEPLQDVWFVRTNGFVGKLEFIRENHEVSRRLKRLLNN
jgi:hypothetical protein